MLVNLIDVSSKTRTLVQSGYHLADVPVKPPRIVVVGTVFVAVITIAVGVGGVSIVEIVIVVVVVASLKDLYRVHLHCECMLWFTCAFAAFCSALVYDALLERHQVR